MKAFVSLFAVLTTTSALAFGPPGIDVFDPVPHLPVTPLFWGTNWHAEDGSHLHISVDTSIHFNGSVYASRMNGTPTAGSYSEAGSVWSQKTGVTYCTLVQRTATIGRDGDTSMLILTEKVYERPSSSRGYLCRLLPSAASYDLASETRLEFRIEANYVFMTALRNGQELKLARAVESFIRSTGLKSNRN